MAINDCTTCRYYFPTPEKGEGFGTCKRYPPIIPSTVTVSFQPWFVGEGTWCGEYKNATDEEIPVVGPSA